MNPLRLAQGGPGQPSPGERYYLWEGPGRQSGPYTHADLVVLLKRSARARVRDVQYVFSVTPEQLDILDSLRSCKLTARQLAEDTGKSPEVTRQHLHAMARAALVAHTAGRPAQWAITDRGRAVLAQFDPRGAP